MACLCGGGAWPMPPQPHRNREYGTFGKSHRCTASDPDIAPQIASDGPGWGIAISSHAARPRRIRYPEGRIGRPTEHERDTVQRMPERRTPCREIAREPGRSPSTVSAEVPRTGSSPRPPMKRGFPRRRRIRTPPQRNPRTRISTCEPVCSLARVFRSC